MARRVSPGIAPVVRFSAIRVAIQRASTCSDLRAMLGAFAIKAAEPTGAPRFIGE